MTRHDGPAGGPSIPRRSTPQSLATVRVRDLVRATGTLTVRCPACSHVAALDVIEVIGWIGIHAQLRELRARLRCGHCGNSDGLALNWRLDAVPVAAPPSSSPPGPPDTRPDRSAEVPGDGRR